MYNYEVCPLLEYQCIISYDYIARSKCGMDCAYSYNQVVCKRVGSFGHVHCKNESVYCTPFCPNAHTFFVFSVCIGTI